MRLVSTKAEGEGERPPRRAAPPAAMPRFLTVEEVAELLRCKPSTIYQLVHKRRIPFRKAGRQLLFEVGEIDAWTKSGADKQ